jgi:hypothetical protein
MRISSSNEKENMDRVEVQTLILATRDASIYIVGARVSHEHFVLQIGAETA